MTAQHTCCRRSILTGALGCGAYTMLSLALSESQTRNAFAASHSGSTVIEQPFARIEKLTDGVWASISTPNTGDMTTVSNGGIIAGNDAVLVIEGFNTPKGGAWMRQAAKELTGKYPTHVILTHYHGDHSNGLSGYMYEGQAPSIIATTKTRELLLNNHLNQQFSAENSTIAKTGSNILIPNTVIVDTSKPTEIDLGGKMISIVPRMGHTPSDLTIELDDPNIVWCGDLFFNHMFPYYGDAIPSALSKTCHSFMKDEDKTYVPGHGSVAVPDDIKHYLALLDHVGEAAKGAFKKGKSADEAWQEYTIPASLGEWSKFMPNIYKFAFTAWEKELKG